MSINRGMNKEEVVLIYTVAYCSAIRKNKLMNEIIKTK